ncbi:class I SAM-dependent methyltransferase [Defluviitalea phaphyphila]|uniref:class I SAM-dependent methyltransferase n=1 Tax=Defluviitalea phaphyphila TaxID=1473580 RepID=UPI000731AB6C|nr:class I SAM-dependent methyltransferase [Defluviitalea phaphyphila]
MSIEYYNKNAKEFFINTVKADMSSLYVFFLQYIKSKGHILDLGCGSGRDSLFFINNGYKVTAVDGSKEMAKLGSKFIKQPVLNIKFQEINFFEEFDGVWACASLLHINDSEIDDVLNRIYNSLKPKGIFYSSFKYGDKKEWRDGRYFRYHNEKSFNKLIQNHKGFELIKLDKTKDVRENRPNEYWLNAWLIKK